VTSASTETSSNYNQCAPNANI